MKRYITLDSITRANRLEQDLELVEEDLARWEEKYHKLLKEHADCVFEFNKLVEQLDKECDKICGYLDFVTKLRVRTTEGVKNVGELAKELYAKRFSS